MPRWVAPLGKQKTESTFLRVDSSPTAGGQSWLQNPHGSCPGVCAMPTDVQPWEIPLPQVQSLKCGLYMRSTEKRVSSFFHLFIQEILTEHLTCCRYCTCNDPSPDITQVKSLFKDKTMSQTESGKVGQSGLSSSWWSNPACIQYLYVLLHVNALLEKTESLSLKKENSLI